MSQMSTHARLKARTQELERCYYVEFESDFKIERVQVPQTLYLWLSFTFQYI